MAIKKVLLFTPEASIIPHYASMAIIGKTLQELGDIVYFAKCDNDFDRCVGKDSANVTPGQPRKSTKTLCERCKSNALAITKAYGLDTLSLGENVPSYAFALAEQAVIAAGRDLLSVTLDGVNFGGFVWHDLILSRKITLDTPITENLRQQFIESLSTAFASYEAVRNLIRIHGIDILLVNGQYAPNMSAVSAAQREGIEWRIVSHAGHCGVDRRYLTLFRSEWREYSYDLCHKWPDLRLRTLEPEHVFAVFEDILFRTTRSHSHVYSKPRNKECRDLRKDLNLPTNRKILVAYTSSLDEQDAQTALEQAMERPQRPYTEQPFVDQADWMGFMMRALADHPDWHLVVRIHPREDANKRENIASTHFPILRRALQGAGENVTIIWPQDEVSSYDLMEIADVVLNAWSTMGLESARVGVPVIMAFNERPWPMADFLTMAKTKDEYLARIEELASTPPSLERIMMAYRWYAATRFSSAVNIGDLVPNSDFRGLPAFTMPRNAQMIREEIVGARPALLDRWCDKAVPPTSTSTTDAAVEAVRLECRRLTHFFLTGEIPEGDVPIRLTIENSPENTTHPTIFYADGICQYSVGGRSYQKYSPLSARLACLSAFPPF